MHQGIYLCTKFCTVEITPMISRQGERVLAYCHPMKKVCSENLSHASVVSYLGRSTTNSEHIVKGGFHIYLFS